MTANPDATHVVQLRAIEDGDLDTLFEHQADPVAAAMAAFPSRNREEFDAHRARTRLNESAIQRAVLVDGVVAGDIGSWEADGERLVGYWIGRKFWGQGVATRALALLVGEVPTRPLFAHVAVHNTGSIRVLEKCGFKRDTVREAEAPEPEDGIEEFVFVLAE